MSSKLSIKKIRDNPKVPTKLKMVILLSSNWTFQGILYMDRSECLFKLIVDAFFFILNLVALLLFFPNLNIIIKIIIAFIGSHTINWIINGQLFVVLKNLKKSITSYSCFIEYAQKLEIRGQNNNSISAIIIYGSLSKKKLTIFSDLDVRVLRRNGLRNTIIANIFVMKERTRAFYHKFPLDILLL